MSYGSLNVLNAHLTAQNKARRHVDCSIYLKKIDLYTNINKQNVLRVALTTC